MSFIDSDDDDGLFPYDYDLVFKAKGREMV